MFKKLNTHTHTHCESVEATFQVRAHPSLQNHPIKGIFHMTEIGDSVPAWQSVTFVDPGSPSAGLESSFNSHPPPQYGHLLECRLKGVDPSGKYCSQKRACLSKVPWDNLIHTGLLASFIHLPIIGRLLCARPFRQSGDLSSIMPPYLDGKWGT